MLALVLILAAAPDSTIKLFRDKDAVLMRAPEGVALSPGTELDLFIDAAGQHPAGKALVVETRGALTRITLDDAALAAKASYARAPAAQPAAAPAPQPPTPAPATEPWPPLPGAISGARPTLPLVARWRDGRIAVSNTSTKQLSNCKGVATDGRAMGCDIYLSKDVCDVWDGPGDLLIKCDQGQARFPLARGGTVQKLVGRADKRVTGITLWNESDTKWTHCELRLPRGQYVMSALAAGSSEDIRYGLFQEIDDRNAYTYVSCDQGESLLKVQ